jgi:subtilisin family serine protease
VRTAEPDGRYQVAATPTDPRFGEQWGFQNTGQSGGTPGADSRAVPAWDWARGTGVVVGVVDEGVDFSRPDLAGKQAPGAWDFVNGDATVFDPADGDKHGTHVAGTIAANTNNGELGAGMAWGAQILSVKCLGPSGGSYTTIANGITYAVNNGADVLNCSFGGSGNSQVMADAIAYAATRNVLVICAAGNSGANSDVTPFYPAALPATNVVSVASTTRTDGLSSFSNYGATSVDLGAPGSLILSTQPKLSSGLLVNSGAYRIVYYAFPAESITNAGARNTAISGAMAQLASSTTSPVLVVDDSWPGVRGEGSTTRLSAYLSALSAAGYSNVTTYSVQASGTPIASQLASRTVVWFTGGATMGLAINYSGYSNLNAHTLNLAERNVLAGYLDGGGRLFMSSGELAYDMYSLMLMGSTTTWPFFTGYFHATCPSNDPWTYDLTGRSGTALAGLSATIADPLWGSYGCDDVVPADAAATTIADWSDSATISGTSMATPHVTGVVALMLSRTPTLTAGVARQRLLAGVDPIAALAGKCVTGGRLNAASAVGTLAAPAPLLVGPGTGGSLAVAWGNPTDADFAATRVLARAGTQPSDPNDASATVIYEGTGTSSNAAGFTAGTQVHIAAWARNALGSWSEAARVTTTVAPPQTTGVPVPVGTNVSVTTGGATVTFPVVRTPGWLSVTRMTPREVSPPNLRWLLDGYYEIHAEGDFDTPVDIRVTYADTSGVDESRARFYHRVGQSWDDVTLSVDTANNTIHARTNSFSDFGGAAPGGTQRVAMSVESPWTGVVLVGVVAAVLLVTRRRTRSAA